MNCKFLTAVGFLGLCITACSNDTSSNAASETDSGITSHVQEIKYEDKDRVFQIDSGVTEVHLSGTKDKQVYFARANIKKDDEGLSSSIAPENQTYIKSVAKQKAMPSLKWAATKNRQNHLALAKESADDGHEYEIPTTELKQLTKSDIKVGETKRVFKIPNNRYYDEAGQVIDNPDEKYKDEYWINLEFVACAVSENAIVWIPTSNIDPKTNQTWTYSIDDEIFNAEAAEKITSKMCEALTEKFEAILPYETAIFGEKSTLIFSKGSPSFYGEPSEPVDIKRYTNLANFTNILIYNFSAISGSSPSQQGFFDYKDYEPAYEHFGYKTSKIRSAFSNEGNFLYLSEHCILNPDYFGLEVDEETGVPYDVYSSLAHEYMHSLQHARKIIEQGKFSGNTAFGELLGQLSEYIMAPKLGIPQSEDLVTSRLLRYHVNYVDIGLTESDDLNPLMYQASFALGAFLIHNYGGQEILSEMLHNSYVGNKSITEAIKKVTGKTVKMEEVFKHFMEAMTCRGSEYAENLKKDLTIKAGTESFTRKGFNNFDLKEDGYISLDVILDNQNEIDYMFNSIKILDPNDRNESLELHDGYGFHVYNVNITDNADTTTLFFDNDGIKSPYERLYILVGDKE